MKMLTLSGAAESPDEISTLRGVSVKQEVKRNREKDFFRRICIMKNSAGMRRFAAVMVLIVMTLAMTAASFAGSGISRKAAENKALKDAKVKRSQVTRLESEKDGGVYEIEFVKKSNGAEFSYEITTKGKIREKSVDYNYKRNSSKSKIGKTAARKKAAKHSGVSYNKVKKGSCIYSYDHEDREGKYELHFTSGSYRYEYDILAPTGAVMEYSKKLK